MFLVCGEALFDVFVGEGRPDTGIAMQARAGGSPYNVAIGLARLGTPVALFAGLSRDVLGQSLAGQLDTEGVSKRFLVRSERPTTLSLVALDAGGSPTYAFYGSGAADSALSSSDLPTLDAAVTGIHVGSYSLVVAPAADALAALVARERHRLIALDPNVRPTIEPDIAVWHRRIDALLPHVSLVKSSREDLATLYPEASVEAVAQRWLRQGPALVVVTDGSNGARAFSATLNLHRAAPSVTVVDTVGAGDSFQSALLHALVTRNILSRATLATLTAVAASELLEAAIRAASITCSRQGADLPRADDLHATPAR